MNFAKGRAKPKANFIGINGQQAVKIKNGEVVRFYARTLARLAKKLLKKNVA